VWQRVHFTGVEEKKEKRAEGRGEGRGKKTNKQIV
jgi:hypothetical protein